MVFSLPCPQGEAWFFLSPHRRDCLRSFAGLVGDVLLLVRSGGHQILGQLSVRRWAADGLDAPDLQPDTLLLSDHSFTAFFFFLSFLFLG